MALTQIISRDIIIINSEIAFIIWNLLSGVNIILHLGQLNEVESF